MKLNEQSQILITGGTGSFGKAFTAEIFKRFPNIKRLVIFSRDELKQWEMQQKFPLDKYPQLRFFLGDIRDRDRLKTALKGIDIVVHAAALKQVPAAEYNPMEFVNTNVLGAENIVQACLDSNVKNVIALSTDKAAAPINLYGATKLCSDKLFVAANNISGEKNIKFSVVRYGNVMGSRGSVIPFFMNQREKGILPITDISMTRFNITLSEGVDMVIDCLDKNIGGEIFVPKIPSYRITDLAKAVAPSCELKIIGLRPGEKIHEEMVTSSDSFSTVDLKDYFVILPSDGRLHSFYSKESKGIVEKGFSYSSDKNDHFLSIEEIRNLIKINLYKDFKPL